MDQIYDAVVLGKRDIRLVKDAQSKVGAENYIIKHGLQDQLYVDDRDIDGDGIPDIVVKTRAGDLPYIVIGYTTEDSTYPYRNVYYTAYPTAEERRGHSMRDFIEDEMVTGYAPNGQGRVFSDQTLAYEHNVTGAGYKSLKPKNKLTYSQAFKKFIMKPVMAVIKQCYKELETPLSIPADVAVRVESTIKNNLIVAPVMQKVYGDEVMQVNDPTEWQKLTQRKQVRDLCAGLAGELIQQRINLAGDFVHGILDALDAFGVRVPQKEENAPMIIGTLLQDESFNAPKLPRP
jgi:hypothetical protein